MLNKKFFSLVFLVFVCCFATIAQKNYLKKANRLLGKFQYSKALPLFKATYEATESPDALIGVVESLKGMGDLSLPENEPFLASLVELEGVDPKYKFMFGQHLMSNEKYEAAKSVFADYAENKPNDSRGISFLRKANKLAKFRDENGFYEIYSLDMNSEFDDYSPIYFNEGLIFSSDRGGINADRIYAATGRPFCDLYFSATEANDPAVHSTAELWGNNINTLWHEGTCDISSDGETIYFTRDNYENKELRESEDDIVKLKIYTGKKLNDGSWTIFNELTFNSDEYSVMHPSLSADGNALYFSSDMPGGFGGADIYVSYKTGSSWGEPQNLGPNVNSEGREVFPNMSEDGTTLHFASDGIAGFGGLDIFKTQLIGGSWEEAFNLGKPINSGQDDFGFIIDNKTKTGYFTSRREGGRGLDDIYTFKKCLVLKGLVYDKDTDLPIPEANVIVEDERGNIIFEDYSNEDGIFKTCIEQNTNFTVKTSHPDFPNNGFLAFNSNETDGELLTINIPMEIPPPPPPKPCYVTGTVVERESGRPIPGILVMIQGGSKGKIPDVYSDRNGNYSFEVFEGEIYRIFTSSENYYTGSVTLNTQGKNCDEIMDLGAQNLTIGLDAIQVGVPIALNHIYYDFNEYYIREEAKPELTELLVILLNNPAISIELASHTDSRASGEYNLSLSQKRADEVKNWLVARGVEDKRIEPVGYGESRLLNECRDGTKCSDKRHQENRRTEFMVIDVSGPRFSNPRVITENGRGGKNYSTETMPTYNSYNSYSSGSSTYSGSSYSSGSSTYSSGSTSTYTAPTKTVKKVNTTKIGKKAEKEVKKQIKKESLTIKDKIKAAKNKGKTKMKKIDGKEYIDGSPEYEAAKKRKIQELIEKRKAQMKKDKGG